MQNQYKKFHMARDRPAKPAHDPIPMAHAVLDERPKAGKLGERGLCLAILETTYLDLQRPVRWREYEAALAFVQGETQADAERFTWMCATIEQDESWLRAKLLATKRPALDLTPAERRRFRRKL